MAQHLPNLPFAGQRYVQNHHTLYISPFVVVPKSPVPVPRHGALRLRIFAMTIDDKQAKKAGKNERTLNDAASDIRGRSTLADITWFGFGSASQSGQLIAASPLVWELLTLTAAVSHSHRQRADRLDKIFADLARLMLTVGSLETPINHRCFRPYRTPGTNFNSSPIAPKTAASRSLSRIVGGKHEGVGALLNSIANWKQQDCIRRSSISAVGGLAAVAKGVSF
ncbi:hypothetical protein SODALDRAFT_362776 [Sodiomyces alkalinus F11]|uniref:Uncharacterized protein n=1 Tax=Sodiomyces alkalinus (strain CBS 110278 / VKM F-3762 / F11) TaxID=1314773 RepID=A0A3N2PN27_SODAK|nr:hypothetical protein SODALDRAFT_362776 [Sodiomyces alkalinus F11]ROT35922.1 hypothetical protein SODALDRAFT_362776 [Sodiomyces alkalinus F11]